MNNIILSSSSFLIPNNISWDTLRKNHKLSFSNYNDWANALIDAKQEDIFVLIIVLNDLFDSFDKNKNINELIETLFHLLQNRLKKSKKLTIFFFSNKNRKNIIRKARSTNLKNNLIDLIIKKFGVLEKKYSHFFLFNINDEFSNVGYDNAFDTRNWYFANCHFSTTGLSIISHAIEKIIFRADNAPSKVLVLDCDNTLWGGVIGEDNLDGIILGNDGIGKAFFNFQQEIKRLADEGVILVIISKNFEDDVWNVFENHSSMFLKKNDIVAWEINWNEKSQNLLKLSNELNLGIDSFVFWDDNPIERDKMKQILPNVKTVDVPVNVYEWPDLLKNMIEFSKFSITSDDLNKTKQYKNRAKFVRDSAKILDQKSYLRSIKLNPKLHNLEKSNIKRAVQLCQKTNQFNLRTKRHTEYDLLKIFSKNKEFCFMTNLKDIYGDHGIISLVCLDEINSDYLFLDTFLMSCRVLGRNLEAWILQQSINRAKSYNYKYLVGEFIETKKNIFIKDFLLNNNFSILPDNLKFKLFHENDDDLTNRNLFFIKTDYKNKLIQDIYE